MMAGLPLDYDSDPGRWLSHDLSWQVTGDVHNRVAELIESAGSAAEPIVDVGGGDGRLVTLLRSGTPSVVVDLSVAQLARAPHPKVRGSAARLPLRSGTAGAAVMLWMLYHLDDPVQAITEAKRVLRPGALFFASTASRRNDPELTDGYEATGFDAEEAEEIVASVFDDVRVERWDGPLTHLPDREAVLRYCRSHLLPASAAERVAPPVWLTKRGCLVIARS
jgi:SAM-dependent methyltransferase